MDVDSDLDSKLLQQFSSMGTTDRDVLVSELQQLLGNQLNAEGCAFFLDMNNWNLQAAICAYYDFEQPSSKVPCMGLVRDVTIGEGESVPPNTRFTKTWMVQNTGQESWPPGCCLKFVQGDQLGHIDRVMVHSLQPGETIEISVEMQSPSETQRLYQGQWRMATASGLYFGEMIWVIISVEETGLLGVTQQLSKMGNEFQHHISSESPVTNPFGSPHKGSEGSFFITSSHDTSSSSVIAQPGSHPSSPFSSTSSHEPFNTGSVQATATALIPSEDDTEMS